MVQIKNVAFIGASGSLGTPVLNAFLESGKFNITVLKRESSTSTFPAGVKVISTDLSSVEAVTAAFKDQDAVVSTVGSSGIAGQKVFIDAAVTAGVKRFLPSDFGCDLQNPKVAALPVYRQKIVIHNALKEAATTSPLTYTLVCNNSLLDWGLKMGLVLDWKEGKPKFFDGGDTVFGATMLASVGQAVVGVLSHYEETKNRFVYVRDIELTQKKLLELAKKAVPEKKWEEPILVSTAELEKSSNESLAKGEVNQKIMVSYIMRALFGSEYGSSWEKDDNKLLGLKGKTEEDIEAVLKTLLTGKD